MKGIYEINGTVLCFCPLHSTIALNFSCKFSKQSRDNCLEKRISCLNCALKSRKLETLISYIFMTFSLFFPLLQLACKSEVFIIIVIN